MLEHPYEPSTWLPYLAIFVEALKATGWPIAIMVAFLWLRRPIMSLLPRISSLKAAGVELSLDSAKENQIAKTEPKDVQPVGVVRNLQKTTAIIDGERRIRNELEKFPDTEHLDLLVNALAILHLERHFAFVYFNIFGSQIRALQKINENGGLISFEDAEAEFKTIKEIAPELGDWTLERYTAYLESNYLVEKESNGYRLTPVGKDFIQFLVRFGLSTHKPL